MVKWTYTPIHQWSLINGRWDEILNKARNIKLLISDNDGVLTDTGVYYSAAGEEFKKYSARDGMGVERLRNLCNIETFIITGEESPSLIKRAEKLKVTNLFLNIKNKLEIFNSLLLQMNLNKDEVAYIGDDLNDIEVIKSVGLSAAPKDAMEPIRNQVDYICSLPGGNGAFRELAELVIYSKYKESYE